MIGDFDMIIKCTMINTKVRWGGVKCGVLGKLFLITHYHSNSLSGKESLDMTSFLKCGTLQLYVRFKIGH